MNQVLRSSMPFRAAMVGMVTTIAAVAIAVTAATDAAGPPASKPDHRSTIIVETWNIRHDNPGDGPHAWPHRRGGVIEHLRSGAADIVSLQEVLPGQLAEIRRDLPEYEVFGRSRERDATRGEAVPILWRRDRWRLDESKATHFWLSETPEVPGSMSWRTACTRMATVVRLVPATNGEASSRTPIWVCSVHLDHRSAEARLQGARLIRARMDRMTANHPGEPVVVMGDFNAAPGSPPISALCGPGDGGAYVDAWAAVTDRDAKATGESPPGTPAGTPAGTPSGTWNGWRLDARATRIDLILVRGLAVRSADILRPTNDAGPLSDHWPVRAVLASPRNPASAGE